VVGALEDTDFTRPSLLPGWSVSHVLTHVARNAEAMCRRVDGALRSEVVEQYAGGPSGRAAEIETGAQRTPAEIRDDVIGWSIRLDELFESSPDDVWGRPVRTVAGGEHPAGLLPFRRWREVEVHLVDLDLGVSPADWSDGLVDRALPRLIDGLIHRADQRELMAWLLGRGPAPELRPWG
jgi:maleylpyruvate isomerase